LRSKDPRLAQLLADGVAVFEADGVHGDVGWTVMVRGPGRVTGRRFTIGDARAWDWD
jgi:hypothetical protein